MFARGMYTFKYTYSIRNILFHSQTTRFYILLVWKVEELYGWGNRCVSRRMVPNGVKLYGHGSQIVKCECKVSVFPVHEYSFTWFDMFRFKYTVQSTNNRIWFWNYWMDY